MSVGRNLTEMSMEIENTIVVEPFTTITQTHDYISGSKPILRPTFVVHLHDTAVKLGKSEDGLTPPEASWMMNESEQKGTHLDVRGTRRVVTLEPRIG